MALVTVQVAAETPAAKAGLQAGDRLYRLNGEPAVSRIDAAASWEGHTDPIVMLVERNGRFQELSIDPQSAPLRVPSRFEPTGITHRSSIVDVTPPLREGDGVRTLVGHTSSVRSMAFSPDGRLVATGGFDHLAALWDASAGTRIAWLSGHTAWINAVAFSPDGTRLATGSFDGTVRVWDTTTHQQLQEIAAGARVYSIAWSPSGTRLAVGCDDHGVKVWDMATGQLAKTLGGHQNVVECVAFSPDGRFLASASWDKNIVLWDTSEWRESKRLSVSLEPRSLAFAPDGRTLALAGGPEPVVQLWNTGVRADYCDNEWSQDMDQCGGIRS